MQGGMHPGALQGMQGGMQPGGMQGMQGGMQGLGQGGMGAPPTNFGAPIYSPPSPVEPPKSSRGLRIVLVAILVLFLLTGSFVALFLTDKI